MKLIIDIPDEDYKFIKEVQLYLSVRRSGKTIERNVINSIKNGIPYEDKIEKVIDLLETEWGYEGIREDVARIMRGGE